MIRRRPNHRTRQPQLGQAALEFALVLTFAVLTLFVIIKMEGGIKETFKQKDSDVHARVQAYLHFDHGNQLNAFDMEGVFLPPLDLSDLLPDLPGFDFDNLLQGLGDILLWQWLVPDFMDALGFGIKDGIVGNAINQAGIDYVASGFDPEAAKRGALRGAVASAQFGRFLDSSFDHAFRGFDGEGLAWQEYQEHWGYATNEAGYLIDSASTVVDSYGDAVRILNNWADFAGSFSQGALLGYVTSEGDMRAALAGGLSQGWSIDPIQSWLATEIGSEVLSGAVHGGVNGSFTVVAGTDRDPIFAIAGGAALGAAASRPVQDRIFGVKRAADGTILPDSEPGFFRTVLGSGLNSSLTGGIAYAENPDNPALLYAAVAGSMVSSGIGYGYEHSGARQWVDDRKEDAREMFHEVGEVTRFNAAKDKVKGGIDTVGDKVKAGFSRVGDSVSSAATSTGGFVKETFCFWCSDKQETATALDVAAAMPTTSQFAATGSVGKTTNATTNSTSPPTASQLANTLPVTNVASTQKAIENFDMNTLIATAVLGYAMFADPKAKSAKNSAASAPPASSSGPSKTPSSNNPTKNMESFSSTNSANSAGLATKTTDSATTKSLSQTSTAAKIGSSSPASKGFASKRANNTPVARNPLRLRQMPHDVNSGKLVKSQQVQQLRRHGKIGLNMVKQSIVLDLMANYRQQLRSSGLPANQIHSLLSDPETVQRMQEIVDDPRVEATIEEKLQAALEEENLEANLDEAKARQIRKLALYIQLAQRELERQKKSTENIYSDPEKKQLLTLLWERILAAHEKLGELI